MGEGKIENSKGWWPAFAAVGVVHMGKQGLEKLHVCVVYLMGIKHKTFAVLTLWDPMFAYVSF